MSFSIPRPQTSSMGYSGLLITQRGNYTIDFSRTFLIPERFITSVTAHFTLKFLNIRSTAYSCVQILKVQQKPQFKCLIAPCRLETVLPCKSYCLIKIIIIVFIKHHPDPVKFKLACPLNLFLFLPCPCHKRACGRTIFDRTFFLRFPKAFASRLCSLNCSLFPIFNNVKTV